MTLRIDRYDVTKEPDLRLPQDFHRRSRLLHVDRGFRAEIINVIRLTDMEKLFHIRLLDDTERQAFVPAGPVRDGRGPGYGRCRSRSPGPTPTRGSSSCASDGRAR